MGTVSDPLVVPFIAPNGPYPLYGSTAITEGVPEGVPKGVLGMVSRGQNP